MNAADSMELKEQLSALLDGELDRDQALFLLRRIEHDESLRALWERMCLCGDALRDEPVCSPSFAARVSAAIAEEAPPTMQANKRTAGQRSWFGTVAGGALAAAVAYGVVIVGSQTGGESQGALAPTLASAPLPEARSAASVTGAMTVASPVFNTASARFGDASQPLVPVSLNLDPYLLRHGEAMSGGLQGEMQPFIYPVSHSDAKVHYSSFQTQR